MWRSSIPLGVGFGLGFERNGRSWKLAGLDDLGPICVAISGAVLASCCFVAAGGRALPEAGLLHEAVGGRRCEAFRCFGLEVAAAAETFTCLGRDFRRIALLAAGNGQQSVHSLLPPNLFSGKSTAAPEPSKQAHRARDSVLHVANNGHIEFLKRFYRRDYSPIHLVSF